MADGSKGLGCHLGSLSAQACCIVAEDRPVCTFGYLGCKACFIGIGLDSDRRLL